MPATRQCDPASASLHAAMLQALAVLQQVAFPTKDSAGKAIPALLHAAVLGPPGLWLRRVLASSLASSPAVVGVDSRHFLQTPPQCRAFAAQGQWRTLAAHAVASPHPPVIFSSAAASDGVWKLSAQE